MCTIRAGAVLAALDHGGVEGGHQPLPVQGDEAVEVALGLLQVLVQADVQVYRVLRHAAPPSSGRVPGGAAAADPGSSPAAVLSRAAAPRDASPPRARDSGVGVG